MVTSWNSTVTLCSEPPSAFPPLWIINHLCDILISDTWGCQGCPATVYCHKGSLFKHIISAWFGGTTSQPWVVNRTPPILAQHLLHLCTSSSCDAACWNSKWASHKAVVRGHVPKQLTNLPTSPRDTLGVEKRCCWLPRCDIFIKHVHKYGRNANTNLIHRPPEFCQTNHPSPSKSTSTIREARLCGAPLATLPRATCRKSGFIAMDCSKRSAAWRSNAPRRRAQPQQRYVPREFAGEKRLHQNPVWLMFKKIYFYK